MNVIKKMLILLLLAAPFLAQAQEPADEPTTPINLLEQAVLEEVVEQFAREVAPLIVQQTLMSLDSVALDSLLAVYVAEEVTGVLAVQVVEEMANLIFLQLLTNIAEKAIIEQFIPLLLAPEPQIMGRPSDGGN